MRGENGRAFRIMIRRIAAHGITVAVERVETRVGVPGFIKVNIINAFRQQILRLFRVVAHAVVGTVGNHGVNRFRIGGEFFQRMFVDLLLNGLGHKL